MIYDEVLWKEKIADMRRLIRAAKNFAPAMELVFEIHAFVHMGEVSDSSTPTLADAVLDGLREQDYAVMPTKKDETIAWHLWHTSRIEDLVANLLIAGQNPILDAAWLDKLGISVRDTGNIMTDAEIIAFSRDVNKPALAAYRNAVGKQTRTILKALTAEDLKRKPAPEHTDRIIDEGGLLPEKGSLWLKDFWANKTIAGLLVLPITRHHFMHLPDSLAIRTQIHEGLTAPYRSAD